MTHVDYPITVSSNTKTLPTVGTMAILVLLGLAVNAFFMGIASAHKELKISPYDSDIPTWLIALVSVITVGSIMLCFKCYFKGRLFSFCFYLCPRVFLSLSY